MKDKKNLVMVIIIGITISLFFCFNTTVFATTGTVTTSDLRLRKEENTTSEILTLLNENDEVEIISENGDWYKVKSYDSSGNASYATDANGEIIKVGDKVKLTSKVGDSSTYVMDVNNAAFEPGTNVQIYENNNTVAQRFTFLASNTSGYYNHNYMILISHHQKKMVISLGLYYLKIFPISIHLS